MNIQEELSTKRDHNDQVAKLVLRAYAYDTPSYDELVLITSFDNKENVFYGRGEISKHRYGIEYDSVDLKNDLFYELTPLNQEVSL